MAFWVCITVTQLNQTKLVRSKYFFYKKGLKMEILFYEMGLRSRGFIN